MATARIEMTHRGIFVGTSGAAVLPPVKVHPKKKHNDQGEL